MDKNHSQSINLSEDKFTFLNTDYIINEQWLDLFIHFVKLNHYKVMPTKEWYNETEELIAKVGEEDFKTIGLKWIQDCVTKSKEDRKYYSKIGMSAAYVQIEDDLGLYDDYSRKYPEWVKKVYGEDIPNSSFITTDEKSSLYGFQNYFYQTIGGRILRGFIHSTIINKDPNFINLVNQLALNQPNSSQDAIYVYSQLPEEIAIPNLTNLKVKAKSSRILKLIDKVFIKFSENSQKSMSELEDSVLPDFGINNKGQYVFKIDTVECIFEIKNSKEQSTYYRIKKDQIQKSIPKHIKENFPEKLKEFKRTVKEIKTTLSAQSKRIENFYLENKSIPYGDFKKFYLKNNFIRILAKDLIWNFQNNKVNVHLIYSENGFIDYEGKLYTKELRGTKVTLWHPIYAETENIFNWRNFLLENEILQPFKQAFREIYVLTDAEKSTKDYSNRYASHILKKDQLFALCKVRGWNPNGLTQDKPILYKIPNSNLIAHFFVNDIDLGERSKLRGLAHVTTDRVIFYNKKKVVDLVDISEIVFSEVMRDLDLFVGVTSIGNDPNWYNRDIEQTNNYWENYINKDLTELSKIRVETLKRLIPKMSLAKQASFNGKFLIIYGSVRTYKIHMGSGNILMEPNDQYLCIIAKPKKVKSLFIPFEGDNLLSIIISKAMLLAKDDKIKDETILSQIHRK